MTKKEIEDMAYRIYNADWSYQHSDDYSAYLRGEGQIKQLRNDMSLYDWNLENYSALVEKFFEFVASRTRDGIIKNDYRDYWLNKINSLTGR